MTGATGTFPIAFDSKVFAALITERTLNSRTWDCYNVFAINLTGGTFHITGIAGDSRDQVSKYVFILGT